MAAGGTPATQPTAVAAKTSPSKVATRQAHGRERDERRGLAVVTPDDLAVFDRDAVPDVGIEREIESTSPGVARQRHRRRVVGIDDRPVVGRLVRKYARLGRGVRVEGRMAIEVIGRNVE
jgi:hypothetical protein